MSKASIFIIHLFPIFKACNYRIWSSPELSNIRTITIVLRSQWFIRGQIHLPLFGFKILFSSFTHFFCFLLNNIFFEWKYKCTRKYKYRSKPMIDGERIMEIPNGEQQGSKLKQKENWCYFSLTEAHTQGLSYAGGK